MLRSRLVPAAEAELHVGRRDAQRDRQLGLDHIQPVSVLQVDLKRPVRCSARGRLRPKHCVRTSTNVFSERLVMSFTCVGAMSKGDGCEGRESME